MSIYSEDSKPNVLASFAYMDAKEVFENRIKRYLAAAWELIGEKPEVLNLYPHLQAFHDKSGEIVRVSPIPPWVKVGVELSKIDNIALAIIENCFYLKRIKELKIQYDNALCLTAACSELYAQLIENIKIEKVAQEFFVGGYFSAIDGDKQEIYSDMADIYIKQRNNFMREEIKSVEHEIQNLGEEPTTLRVWNELKKRCGQQGSCCLYVETTVKGEVIAWKGSGGQVSRLTYQALQKRMERLKRR